VELRDEISQRAVAEPETFGDIEQRLLIDKNSAESFVVLLTSLIGLKKELLATRIIHDRSSKMSCH
jgi:hypothetical protein